MPDEVLLASAIAKVPHFAAFDKTAAYRFHQLQMDKLLIYLVDTVDASALPWLGQQFNVLGYRGLRLAKSETQQRQVIKNAIQLKRYAGTPWAVKQALIAIGYPNAVITENVGTGTYGWAYFRIDINVGANGISAANISELIEMINIYKGARNHLQAISYQVNFSDGIALIDGNSLEPGINDKETLFIGISRFANGVYIADGSIDASSDSDSLTMNVF